MEGKEGWTAAAVVPLGVDRFLFGVHRWVRREPGCHNAPIFIEIGREVVVFQRFWPRCSLIADAFGHRVSRYHRTGEL